MMHKRTVERVDGRRFILYGRDELADPIGAPRSSRRGPRQSAHLRWHVLRGEWVAYAGQKQVHGAPLSLGEDMPHDLPAGNYDIAVFEEPFPALTEGAIEPPPAIVETRAGRGVCEVIAFPRHNTATLGALPLSQVELLLSVWADRYLSLGALPDVKYVFPFERRGVEAFTGEVRSQGQLHAYPFVPPVAARELGIQRAYRALHGRSLIEDQIRAELGDGRRVLYASKLVVAFVPVCARYSYEVWIAPVRPVPSLAALSAEERGDLARALKVVLLKLEGLWQRPVPYTMVFHQAPTDGEPHPEAHLHVELYPAVDMEGRLKFETASEIGAGVFTADTLPEQKAAELRAVEVVL